MAQDSEMEETFSLVPSCFYLANKSLLSACCLQSPPLGIGGGSKRKNLEGGCIFCSRGACNHAKDNGSMRTVQCLEICDECRLRGQCSWKQTGFRNGPCVRRTNAAGFLGGREVP